MENTRLILSETADHWPALMIGPPGLPTYAENTLREPDHRARCASLRAAITARPLAALACRAAMLAGVSVFGLPLALRPSATACGSFMGALLERLRAHVKPCQGCARIARRARRAPLHSRGSA